ncbi:MAG: hypothetical protein PHT07_01640 [Paludibacter sp.]|nr:hypothetical protein [Paludibacter sp.]
MYKVNEQFYIENIDSWLKEVIDKSMWKNYYDLHIDSIDKVFNKKKLWIEGSLYLRKLILKRIDKDLYDLILVISLKYRKQSNIIPITLLDLQKDLYNCPPSFYIFPKNNSLISETLAGSIQIHNFNDLSECRVHYKEESENKEYCRVLYFL